MTIPLAFNFEGEAFELPSTAVGWRIKRMRSKGAPELVYRADGLPMVLPLDTDMEALRCAVVAPAKYRLDAVDEQQRVIKQAEAAYVVVSGVEAVSATVEASADNGPNNNAALMEAMRQNTELARTVIDRFPAMIEASAVLLRAADGAGLPARKPLHDDLDERNKRGKDEDDEDEDEDDEDDEDDDDEAVRAPEPAPAPASGFDMKALLAELVPVLLMILDKRDMKLSELFEMLDLRRRPAQKQPGQGGPASPHVPAPEAKPEAPTAPAGANGASASAPSTAPADTNGAAGSASASAATDAGPSLLSPQVMAHFLAIQSALTPDEARLAKAAAAELSPADRRAWIEQLSTMSVPEAVERVRKLLGVAKTEAS